ncbi:MAG: ThiF family adenylyltransferase [Actinomycetota bacterium]|nr:ThiF family adenylyltransferase [Actinomycetota bacterium]
MSTMKFTNPQHWRRIEDHLAGASGERFAFAFTRTLLDRDDDDDSQLGPVLEVVDVALIGDADTEHDVTGWYVSDQALDRIHNQAVVTGAELAEFHNHRYGPPRFSPTDRAGLQPSAEYVLDLLPGRPYLAVVWAEGQVHAEWWAAGTSHGTVDTVTVLGDQLRVLSAAPTDPTDELGGGSGGAGRGDRQLPLIGPAGQSTVAALRVAVVGAGGTGSQLLLQLAYLGFGNVLVLDDDLVEVTNLNRLITAGTADVGIAKTDAALRRLRAIDPLMRVIAGPGITVTGDHPELRDVDLIIGCVDHDGPPAEAQSDRRRDQHSVPGHRDRRRHLDHAPSGRRAGGADHARQGVSAVSGRARPGRGRPLGQAGRPAASGPPARLRHRHGEPLGRAPERIDGERRDGRAAGVDQRVSPARAVGRRRSHRRNGPARCAGRAAGSSRPRRHLPCVRASGRRHRLSGRRDTTQGQSGAAGGA